jgi:hypothetical protein
MGSAILRLKTGKAVKLDRAATHDVTVTAKGVSEMRTDWSGYLVGSDAVPPAKGTQGVLEIPGHEPVSVRVEAMEETGRYRRVVGKVVGPAQA